jgi:hypothetical protein
MPAIFSGRPSKFNKPQNSSINRQSVQALMKWPYLLNKYAPAFKTIAQQQKALYF